ncbi:hypothetical protein GQ600_5486 [Phytophthora cactorum]|nr:hypothetical protein GQ600_5486 [Phytophthora cactorum]
MSYERFTQYVHYFYPGLRLTRTAEDVCDCCVRFNTLLQQADLAEEEKARILAEKKTHLSEAPLYFEFYSLVYSAACTEQTLPPQIIPDTYDVNQDYGGSISIPHYGHIHPSVDYFNINFMIQNIVVADISNGRNNVYFYDERAQGKDADALCSLRLLYHLSL